ncbi:MAG: ATP-dependent Clp protease ATP-binding subunit [Lachnospiraceae bacterium]|nr:ATP-dependent Clp protease ATP-binding subunit [Lachnospiraceae bacterium]
MNKPFTKLAEEAMEAAAEAAVRLQQTYVGTEHLLVGLAEIEGGAAQKALQRQGVTAPIIEDLMKSALNSGEQTGLITVQEFSPKVDEVLKTAGEEADRRKSAAVGTEHILLGIIKQNDCAALRLLAAMNVSKQKLFADVLMAMGERFEDHKDEIMPARQGQEKDKKKEKILKDFSKDLCEAAREGRLDPIVGREEEIARIVQILSRRTKNNPCLVGEPGVGKTSIAEALAEKIVNGEIVGPVAEKRVLSLDLPAMVAGSRYRGDFEERMKKVIKEVKEDGHIILFMDEIHTMIGAGGAEGSIDAANILKPALAKGDIQIIGATTLNEYRKHFEKDAALERRFQPVYIEQPDKAATLDILRGLRGNYEKHHNVEITDEALEAAVNLSTRYINDRFLPDKAIDLIDEAASKVKLSSYILPPVVKEKEEKAAYYENRLEECIKSGDFAEAAAVRVDLELINSEIKKYQEEAKAKSGDDMLKVTAEDVADVVSKWTKIPVKKLAEEESEKLRNLEELLHKRVVAQDSAVVSLAKAIRRGRVGLKDPNKPIGSFLFLGPTGVGKTELSKALAEAMFGTENAIIRVDMSEYMEKHSVSKLIGSPPGYVGYDEGGQLSEQVRRNPYSIILFDEIEKAHPDVFNILLQVLDDGRITDSHGRVADFKNTIIIMTSNAGANRIMEPKTLGFATDKSQAHDYQVMKDAVMEEVKHIFKPEFINRIDEIIVFAALTKDDMKGIVDIMLAELAKRAKEQMNLTLNVTDEAKAFLVEKGYDIKYGARSLKRKVQTCLEDEMAEEILAGKIRSGAAVTVMAGEDKLIFEVE